MKVCAQPDCPRIQPNSRCVEHQAERDKHYRATTPTKINEPQDRARRKHAVTKHRTLYGEWCPGWGREQHTLTSTDGGLTADHIHDIQHGGAPTGPLQVLCRSCNARKANTRQAPDQPKR